MEKTNVMRVLTQKKISFTPHEYDAASLSGVAVAEALGEPVDHVYKTLVTVGASKRNYVFVIPAAMELDLKAAAKAAGEKSIQMIPQKELLPLTGYIHGGCSPIGMKKLFPTFVDASAEALDTIYVSAGKVGFQVQLAPGDILALTRGRYAQIAERSSNG